MRGADTAAPAPASMDLALARGRLEAGDKLEIEVARTAIASSLFASISQRPATVGRYQLRQRLGAGGMGIVFAAYDPMLARELAIKLLHPKDASSPASDELLLKEAQNTARLVHPAIVTIFDVGLHEGRVFLAMEQIAGLSMAQWLGTRPPWRHCVAILARAARGIEAAHARGVVHRDFKPANVLLGRDGRVCVADFGLAREITRAPFDADHRPSAGRADVAHAVTRSGDIVGTPAYMAPEQYLGTGQDERTDQFAFCASLYESLFGRRPFEALTIGELREAILTAQPAIHPVSDLPHALLDAVSRGLSKSRRDRFGSMGELAALLESLSEGVDLAQVLGEGAPVAVAARASKYEAYLAQLPQGLATSAEQTLPSQIYKVMLANRPLRSAPAELVDIIAQLPTTTSIPAVHARALLSAIYDAHFESLEQWREFIEGMSQGVAKLMATSFALPKPSSRYFVEGLVGLYNRHASGIRMELVETQAWSGALRMHHPPHTLNDVSMVAWEAFVRAILLAAGCRFVDLVTHDHADESFLVTLQWR